MPDQDHLDERPAADPPADRGELQEALTTVQRKLLERRLGPVLHEHWLMDLGCDHAAETDSPICACTRMLGTYPSVGAAIDAWVRHVLEQVP